MADQQANDTGSVLKTTTGQEGGNEDLRKTDVAQPPPASKTGSDDRESAGGGGTVRGPGGPDTGSDAMPGQSNAL